MAATPVIETARLVLRPIAPGDGRALLPTFMDEAAMRYWSRGPFADLAELDAWLHPADGWPQGRQWAVTERGGDDTPIGRVVAVDQGSGMAELGWLVVNGRQGQGIASEATAGLIGHLFGAEGLRRLYADCDPDNAPSNALCRKLGMTLEGRLRGQWLTHIGERDSFIWGILAREWSPPA